MNGAEETYPDANDPSWLDDDPQSAVGIMQVERR